jgi:hypothetical protein
MNGEAMPDFVDLASRFKGNDADVAREVAKLQKAKFFGFPHEYDDRQRALDREFLPNEMWLDHNVTLRLSFSDPTAFKVAREMLAFCLRKGWMPVQREIVTKGISIRTVNAHFGAAKLVVARILFRR